MDHRLITASGAPVAVGRRMIRTDPARRALRHIGTAIAMLYAALSTAHAQVGYLGPAGSWTHQACIDLFGEAPLVALSREQLFRSFDERRIANACVPVATSVVGPTPYLDEVLSLKDMWVVAEYPKMLGYSLLALPGTTKEAIRTVIAHPVALEEVKPWLDREMPDAVRKPAASGGAAAQEVAGRSIADSAAMGPPIAARIYGLEPIVNGIEEGPHNVTRWWVLGRTLPAPTGNDKTTLLLAADDARFGAAMKAVSSALTVLAIYDRPSKTSLHAHRYVVEVVGHAQRGAVRRFLAGHPEFRLVGSYPRKY